MSKKYNKRYVFTLVGVNINKIDQKYGIVSLQNQEDSIPTNTTKIDDLDIIKRTPEVISFLDESKRIRKCQVSMIDFNSGKNLDLKKRYKCFWDKNYIPENVTPIGCPIKYIASKAKKTYHSEISKEKYTIVENVSVKKVDSLKKVGDIQIVIEDNDYYETDGIFCSFNCCMAYILDPENKNKNIYRQSESLVLKMYYDINMDDNNLEIIPAPHWRTLEDFGGTSTIEEFRNSFNRIRYVDHGIVCISRGQLYEDHIMF